VTAALAAAGGVLLGAIVGSFLATLLIRWPKGEGAGTGRSHCDGCGRRLEAAELVPILSWLWLRGRCRTCGAAIDPRQVAIEAAAALLGGAAALAHPLPLALVTAVFGWWLLIIAALDAEHHWLPDRLTLPLIPAGLAVGWAGFGPPLDQRAIGAAAGFAALALIAFAYRRSRGREGLGGGDPKLFGALGAWLGWPTLPYVLLGAGLVGLGALVVKRLRGEAVAATDRLPLGTLMALAAWPLWLVLAAR
jgi:leader peptidase (prepilin peptidase)/N-methyltransferase